MLYEYKNAVIQIYNVLVKITNNISYKRDTR
jgi:hypothetical protein